MKSLVKKLFLDNWQRKLISLILAVITWMVVNHSMTSVKTVANIPVKVINIPPGKTLEGMQANNVLENRIALTLTGNKRVLDELSSSDLEVIIDAAGKGEEWIATITKKNLVSFNPDIDLNKGIKKVSHHDFIIKLSKLTTERIPILVTKPIGEPPKGYQFLDIWPYELYITVTGPESIVKQLKSKGLKLTFNLNDISKTELLAINTAQASKDSEVVSFAIPNSWKKINLPYISRAPIEIDDPAAKKLRIDFARTALIPLGGPIQINVYFPEKYSTTYNPDTYSIDTNNFIHEKNGIKLISSPLYAYGVSKQFLEVVKDMIEVVIVATPKQERTNILWNIQFLTPTELENKYVSKVISSSTDEEGSALQPHLREEYLRNRFRNYMNRFRLYTDDQKKLNLHIELKNNKIIITPKKNNI